MSNTDRLYTCIARSEATGERVVDLFLSYLGSRVLTDDFIEFAEQELRYKE